MQAFSKQTTQDNKMAERQALTHTITPSIIEAVKAVLKAMSEAAET